MTNPPDPSDRADLRNYISVMQVHRDLGISRRSLYLWMKAGKLGYQRLPSGRRVIFRGDLLAPIGQMPGRFRPTPTPTTAGAA